MRHPKKLIENDTIGICAPSQGCGTKHIEKFETAKENVKALGYYLKETEHIYDRVKCVSADSETRAKEFMELYEDPKVSAILPPWGGEFLMNMLPYLDFEKLKKLPPKWISGYSDITTLTFPLTLMCDVATIHGTSFLNLGSKDIFYMDKFVFEVMSKSETLQQSSEKYGGYTEDWKEYVLDKKTEWKDLYNTRENIEFSGRMIGGCLDTLAKLLGTRFAPVNEFIEKYKEDGFIWSLESCEMSSADIYRTLWQMRQCGWFKHANGILIGRPDGYSDTKDFTLVDALTKSFEGLNIPVIYDADIGHIPPQIQVVNGSYGTVTYSNGTATVYQELRS